MPPSGNIVEFRGVGRCPAIGQLRRGAPGFHLFQAALISLFSVLRIHFHGKRPGPFGFFRFLLGLGEAGNWPGAVKAISEWFPARERAFAIGFFNSGSTLGAVIAPPLVAWLALNYGWRNAFLITGSLGFFWLVLWLLVYQHPRRRRWLRASELQHIESGQEKPFMDT